ncbi:hypothetical protein [Kitasatospora sp. NPDC002965]|uniref:hypothetical protein n=1 Tax=Kitasatospora sp. NPDC002965 TaxID=3154775 RepID=UPI0033B655E0
MMQLPTIDSAGARHVNSYLDSFNRRVAAVIERDPFHSDGDEDNDEEAAEELRDLISGLVMSLRERLLLGVGSALVWREWISPRFGSGSTSGLCR